MYKKIWKDEQGVSPVIATILMVAITVVLAGVLVVYMQQFSKGPGTTIPSASSTSSAFVNPVDGGKTKNGGGWTVQIASISSKDTLWSEVTVQITKDKLPYYKINQVKAGLLATGWVWYTNGTLGKSNWYALANPAGAGMTYCKGSTSACSGTDKLDGAVVPSVAVTDLQTTQNAVMIVVDTDGLGTVTAGDLVLVFASNNGDISPAEISGTSYTLEFNIGGSALCSSGLT